MLLGGLPFSLTLLAILLAHEFGHYLAALYHGVDASLPYFLPSPVLGTFGAFIRVRSPIYSKRVLFDIGVAGPLAGFVFLLPALAVGLAFSKVIPGIAHQGDFSSALPGLQWLLQHAIFPGVQSERYLPAPDRARRLGGDVRHRDEPAAHRATGWRPHSLFVLSAAAQAGFEAAVRGAAAAGRFLVRLGCFGARCCCCLGRRHPSIYDAADLGAGRPQVGLDRAGRFPAVLHATRRL